MNNSETPLMKTIVLPELHGDPAEEPILTNVNPLSQIKTRLQVCVGGTALTVGELMEAREHQIIKLDRTIDQPVDLLLEGHVVARGLLVAIDDHFALRITELPVPLTLTPPAKV